MKPLKFVLLLSFSILLSPVFADNTAVNNVSFDNAIDTIICGQNTKQVLLQKIETCDAYLSYWNYQKKHINLYLIANGNYRIWGQSRLDALYDIEQKLALISELKKRYISLFGLHKKGHTVETDFDKVDDPLLDVRPPTDFDRNFWKYSLAGIAGVIGACLVYKHRAFLTKSIHTLYKNNIKRPWNSLKNYLLDKDPSVTHTDKDIIGQRKALQYKIQDIAKELRPDLATEALERIADHAKRQGFEDFLADFVHNHAHWGINSPNIPLKRKVSWVQLLSPLRKIFGMSPRAKLLELEIKGLISRFKATQMLVDAHDIVNKNKLNLILLTMIPNGVLGLAFYMAYQKMRAFFKKTELAKKKRKMKALLLQINEILTRNVGADSFSDEDYGFLCYYNYRLLRTLPEHMGAYFATLVSELESLSNTIDQKLKIFQSINFALHTW